MTQTDSPVSFVNADGIATITLNRPEAMNGLNNATKDQLLAFVQQVQADPSIRCLILTGSGRAFCVGQDLKEHVEILQTKGPEALFHTVPDQYNPIVTALLEMPKPTIAVLNGVAAGAGLSLAMACDFRLVAETAGMNTAFAGVALSCDTGASWLLPQLVGRAKALDLMFFPRTLTATEAQELGLANQVLPAADLTAAAAELAQKLATGPTQAYASIRAAVNNSATSELAAALSFEADKMQLTGATADHQEAVAAFLTKRAPNFTGN